MNKRKSLVIRPAVLYLAGFTSIVTLAIYLPALRNGFVNWDDGLYVYDNVHIRSLNFVFLKWAFTDLSAGFWHPLTWISYAVDYALWGLDPTGYHLTSIILHSINTFLVVLLAAKLGEAACYGSKVLVAQPLLTPIDARFTMIGAGVTGLLFAIHPLHVESVAWVSERKDLLCAMFFLMSIISYANYSGLRFKMADKWYLNSRYYLSLLFFVCALASKTMAVTLPFVLLILDWYPFRTLKATKGKSVLFIEKIPFIACSLLISLVSFKAQKAVGAFAVSDSIPYMTRVPVAFRALAMYLWKMVMPVELSPFYPYPRQVSLLMVEYLFPLLIIVGFTTICILYAGKNKIWLSAWAYYVITILPVLGLVQLGSFSMADRFTYLPGLGPFFLAGTSVAWLIGQSGAGKAVQRFLVVTVAAAVVFLSYGTLRQITVWKSGVTLWSYIVDKWPRSSAQAYYNLGLAFLDGGNPDSAIASFNQAIDLDPRYIDVFINRGQAFFSKGEFDSAIEDFSKAISLKPAPETACHAYSSRGLAYSEKGLIELAMDDFNRAMVIVPSFSPAYINRAMVFQKTGQPDRAIADYTRAININPSAPFVWKAYFERGGLYYEKKELDLAIEDFNAAIKLNPDSYEGYNNRGVVYEDLGKDERAIEDYTRALSLNPALAGLYASRGSLYMRHGDKELAVKDYQTACDRGISYGCDALQAFRKRQAF